MWEDNDMKDKKYLIPEVVVISFYQQDIILTSDGDGDILTPPSMDESQIPGD